ncbi:MAG: replication-associated recombination protein A [Fusobacteria bacterium]|nr:replication-associated recombination protein A [Fusobacteriota bacterium]
MMLFEKNYENKRPIAYRLRPKNLEDYVGQEELLGEDRILGKLLKNKKIVNSIFYGPPGVGKTSLAEVISNELNYKFERANATNISVNDIKDIGKISENYFNTNGKQTILFLDEIHRFNKLQQDSLLSYTENGLITLIGATTENPYYTLNNSLLSRSMVFEFKPLNNKNIYELIKKSLTLYEIKIDEEILEYISNIVNGDARSALNIIEILIESKMSEEITLDKFKELFKYKINYDKVEDKYNTISAFIKSVRGSDPDASIYWLAKMLDGGEDPNYIARRLMILAAEDIGLANPEALNIAASTLTAAKSIGMPEIRIILAETTIYMAISSKSNSCYNAINEAMEDIKNGIDLKVPKYLTDLGKKDYKYPHSYINNFVKQKYLPTEKKYYFAGDNKNERLIREKLSKLWEDK